MNAHQTMDFIRAERAASVERWKKIDALMKLSSDFRPTLDKSIARAVASTKHTTPAKPATLVHSATQHEIPQVGLLGPQIDAKLDRLSERVDRISAKVDALVALVATQAHLSSPPNQRSES